MFQRQYPDDSYFYVEIARRIDFIYRKYVRQSPQSYISEYKKRNPECRLPQKLIYFLVTRRWSMVKAYPRLQTLNEICKLVGFELWDILSLNDPDRVAEIRGVKKSNFKLIRSKTQTISMDKKFE
jgi:hypothetical protein